MRVLLDTVIWGCELGLITLSLSLSFALVGYANFALLELTGVGAYLALTFSEFAPLPLAAALAVACCGLLAVLLNTAVFRHLQTASIAAKMLVSIAVAFVIRALVQLVWGTGGRFFDIDPLPITTIGGVFITRAQVAVVATTLVALIVFHTLLRHTRFGRALQATAESPTLAEVRGVNSQRVIAGAWFLAGGLASLGGVLYGMDTFVQPSMGFTLIIPVFAAAVVGGMGSLYGAVLGAFLLSFFQNAVINVDLGDFLGLGSWVVGTQYKAAVAMVALVLMLLVRPRGMLGRGTA